MEFPAPPKSLGTSPTVGVGASSSNLLKRVEAFLPEIKAANQEIQEKPSESVCLDATLVKDDDRESSSDSGDDSISSSSSSSDTDADEDGDTKTPTIELKVALGPMKDNPIISMLANDESENDNETSSDERKPEADATSRTELVTNLLESNKESNSPSKKRKVLIEELS